MFRRFFDDTSAFFQGAVLPKELVGLKSDKLLVGIETRPPQAGTFGAIHSRLLIYKDTP
jgi:hypothetical protein